MSGWDYVGNHPASGDPEYQMVVPTLCDSTISAGMCWSVFLVRALTDNPVVYYDSPPDSGYSVDNLAPEPPTGFLVQYNDPTGNVLTWDECLDADFDYFKIYRAEKEGMGSQSAQVVHMTSGTNWTDDVADGWKYEYEASAVDFSGNEGERSGPGGATGADTQQKPTETALYQNVPNPFNPTTAITFTVATAGHVNLTVYDARGAKVRQLVDRGMGPSKERVVWDGRDNNGGRVSTGVYFYRLQTEDRVLTRKMVLLK